MLDFNKNILDDEIKNIPYSIIITLSVHSIVTFISDFISKIRNKNRQTCKIYLSFSEKDKKYIKPLVVELNNNSKMYQFEFLSNSNSLSIKNGESGTKINDDFDLSLVFISSSEIENEPNSLDFKIKLELLNNTKNKKTIPIILHESKKIGKNICKDNWPTIRLNTYQPILIDKGKSRKEYYKQIEIVSKTILNAIEQT